MGRRHTVTVDELKTLKAVEVLASTACPSGNKRLEMVTFVDQSLPIPVMFVVHGEIDHPVPFNNLDDAVDLYNELPG